MLFDYQLDSIYYFPFFPRETYRSSAKSIAILDFLFVHLIEYREIRLYGHYANVEYERVISRFRWSRQIFERKARSEGTILDIRRKRIGWKGKNWKKGESGNFRGRKEGRWIETRWIITERPSYLKEAEPRFKEECKYKGWANSRGGRKVMPRLQLFESRRSTKG